MLKKRISTVQQEDPESSEEVKGERKHNHENNIMDELQWLHTFYNPTLNEMIIIDDTFVDVTSSEYDHIEFFKDAWDH